MVNANMKNILSEIISDDGQYDELEVFLATTGDSTSDDGKSIEYYGGLVVAEYSSRHRIKALLIDETMEGPRTQSLISEIKEALAHGEPQTAQRYLHSHFPATGWYRREGDFQIIPAPTDAPSLGHLQGPHPFLLEYRYRGSTHMHVDQHRSTRRFSELSLVLNVLLRFLQLPNAYTSHEWVISGSPEWKCEYRQLGYWCKSLPEIREDGFSSAEAFAPLETEPNDAYYTSLGVTVGAEMRLPESFSQLLSAYEALSEEQKDKFRRASYWVHVSSRVHATSQSASFAALVSAIEVFLPNPEQRCEKCNRPISDERCDECSQPESGPTRQFRDFVERYSKGIPKAKRSELYGIRSGISHGAQLLPGDLAEMGFRHNSASLSASMNQMLLRSVVQVVLVNWLASPS